MSTKAEREKALQELRDHQAMKAAERAAKGVSQPVFPTVVPAEEFEPLEAVELNQRSERPFIKWISTIQDAPEGDRQDFVVKGNRSKLLDRIELDAEEHDCRDYVVLTDGDQYCVWRMPR